MTRFTLVGESEQPAEAGLFNLRNLLQLFRRRAVPLALTMAVVLVLVAVAYIVAPRLYQASGSVALDRRTDELVEATSGPKPLTTDSSSVDTEVQVIRSPAVAAAVVDGLGLAGTPGFGVPRGANAATTGARDRAIGVVQGGLQAARTGNSYSIALTYAASDPVLAARIVNAAINAYTGGQRSSEAQRVAEEIKMLRDRIGLVRGDLLKTERAVAEYRRKTGLVDLTANSVAAQDTMQALNTQLAEARADEAAARAKAGSRASLANVTSSSAVNALRSEQAKLAAQQAELRERYAEGYPVLVAVNEQLASINRALAAETARVQQGVAAEAGVASNRASSLRQSVNSQQSALMRANSVSVQVGELQRNADAAKSLYASLLDQYKQKLAAQGTERSKAYVVSYAAPPERPASPNALAYLLGGVLASLLAGGVVASTLETFEAGLLTQDMVERELGLPLLAAVPDVATIREAPLKHPTPGAIANHVVDSPTGLLAESLRCVRAELRLDGERTPGRSLTITSSIPDEGKTATAIALARSCAMMGTRVLLIDCDLRHHTSSDLFAPDASVGLCEVLRGERRIEQAIVRDPRTGLDILPAVAAEQPAIDMLASAAMQRLLRDVQGRYDLVILETPPVLPVAETRTLAAMSDSVLLLVRWRTTPVEVARKAIKLLNRADAKIVGSVLTRVNLGWSAMGSLGDDVYYYKNYGGKAA